MTQCEYYRGCLNIGTDWSCSCSEAECTALGKNCLRDYCANGQCCSPTERAKLGTVNPGSQPGTGTSGAVASCSIDNIVSCGSYMRRWGDTATGECITYCEYMKRCGILDQSWGCQCTQQQCSDLGSKCWQGYCPGSAYCCSTG